MKALTLAQKIVKLAEQHAEDTGEADHLVGDLEETLSACLRVMSAQQFLQIAPGLKEKGLPGIHALIRRCKRNPEAALFPDNRCHKCGTELKRGYCSDETCSYHVWPQAVPYADILDLPTRSIETKHQVKKRKTL